MTGREQVTSMVALYLAAQFKIKPTEALVFVKEAIAEMSLEGRIITLELTLGIAEYVEKRYFLVAEEKRLAAAKDGG